MNSELVYDSISDATSLGLNLGASLLMLLLYIGLIVLIIAIQWILFKKAGESGWKCLIPIYNIYILCRIAKRPKLFWKYIVCLILVIISAIIYFIGLFTLIGIGIISSELSATSFATFIIGLIIMLISSIASCIIQCILYFNVGKAFGQDSLFGIGMILMTPIFMGIIAFSKDIQYVGYIDQTNNNIGQSGPNYYGGNYQNPYNYNNQNNNFNNNQNNF